MTTLKINNVHNTLVEEDKIVTEHVNVTKTFNQFFLTLVRMHEKHRSFIHILCCAEIKKNYPIFFVVKIFEPCFFREFTEPAVIKKIKIINIKRRLQSPHISIKVIINLMCFGGEGNHTPGYTGWGINNPINAITFSTKAKKIKCSRYRYRTPLPHISLFQFSFVLF